MDVKIEESWKEALRQEFNQPYFEHIVQFLKTEKQSNKKIFPPGSLIFKSLATGLAGASLPPRTYDSTKNPAHVGGFFLFWSWSRPPRSDGPDMLV